MNNFTASHANIPQFILKNIPEKNVRLKQVKDTGPIFSQDINEFDYNISKKRIATRESSKRPRVMDDFIIDSDEDEDEEYTDNNNRTSFIPSNIPEGFISLFLIFIFIPLYLLHRVP